MTCALLLAAIRVVMAYSNSVEDGRSVLQAGSTLLRGFTWTAIAIVVFTNTTAFGYKWLKTFAWPCPSPSWDRGGWRSPWATASAAPRAYVNFGSVAFPFSELAKLLMVVVLATYLTPATAGWSRCRASLGGASWWLPRGWS